MLTCRRRRLLPTASYILLVSFSQVGALPVLLGCTYHLGHYNALWFSGLAVAVVVQCIVLSGCKLQMHGPHMVSAHGSMQQLGSRQL